MGGVCRTAPLAFMLNLTGAFPAMRTAKNVMGLILMTVLSAQSVPLFSIMVDVLKNVRTGLTMKKKPKIVKVLFFKGIWRLVE